MNFSIPPESETLRKEVRELARNEFMPKAKRWDENDEYPKENIKKLAELGILGLTIPEEYGGSGWDLFNIPIVTEEIAYACPLTAFLLDPFLLTSRIILEYGSEELKKKYGRGVTISDPGYLGNLLPLRHAFLPPGVRYPPMWHRDTIPNTKVGTMPCQHISRRLRAGPRRRRLSN